MGHDNNDRRRSVYRVAEEEWERKTLTRHSFQSAFQRGIDKQSIKQESSNSTTASYSQFAPLQTACSKCDRWFAVDAFIVTTTTAQTFRGARSVHEIGTEMSVVKFILYTLALYRLACFLKSACLLFFLNTSDYLCDKNLHCSFLSVFCRCEN